MMRLASNRRSLLQLVFIWSWALLWSTPPMLGWGRYIPEGLQVSCTFDYLTRTPANIAFNYCLFGLGFLLPVAVTVVAYAGIVRSVTAQSKNLSDACRRLGASRSVHGPGSQEYQLELQLAKVAAATVCLFVVSWLPYAVIAQLAINGYQSHVTPYVTEVPVMFAKASAIWNPIVYGLSHPRYKKELRRMLPVWMPFCRRRGRQATPHSSGLSRGQQGRSLNQLRSSTTMYTITEL